MTTILLVEDNDITRKVVRATLSQEGLSVLEAEDGAAALRLFSEHPVDLVLLDLHLPDLTGFELLPRLRATGRGADLPVLAFSGIISAQDEGRLVSAGFDDVIAKPVEPLRLVEVVRSHLLEGGRPEQERFGAGRSVLVVDDDAVQRKLVAFRLQQLGFEVRTAADGLEGLAQAARRPPDAVLSDVLMPGLDGFGLCVELQRQPGLAGVPVVLATNSYVESGDQVLARTVGARALVVRTPDLRSVLGALREALSMPAAAAPSPSVDRHVVDQERLQRLTRQLERQVAMNARVSQRCAVLSVEMAVLQGIADALANHASTDEALRKVLAACFDAGGISRGALLLGQGAAVRVVSFGFGPGEAEALRGVSGELELAMPGGRAVYLSGAAGGAVLAAAGTPRLVLAPVGHRDERRGALLMVPRDESVERPDLVAFAEAVAAQVGQSLAVAEAFEKLEHAERQAREREAVLRSILSSLGDAVLVADAQGQLIHWNQAAEPLVAFGARDASFQPEGPDYAIYRADRTTVVTPAELPLVKALRGEAVDGVELFVRHPGAPEGVWVSGSGRPWRDEAGQARGGVAVFRDVTRERGTQTQLMASDRMASVGLMAAGVAHEINNPISALITNLELATQALAAEPAAAPGGRLAELGETVRDAHDAGIQVMQIARDLKVFSREDDDERVAVDLEKVLDSSLRMARNEVRHRATLVRDLQPGLRVRGSESRLGQVFLNLVVNAAQAIPEGDVGGNRITVRSRQQGPGLAVVEVTDTGPGMAPQTVARLFKPFFTTKPKGVGTGLGLTICQRIVTEAGGRIEVESKVGQGTTFRVTLALSELPPPRPSAPRPSAAGAKERKRVLVVDDETLVGRAIARLLGRQHEVVAVDSVEEALRRLREGPPFDVILSDLMMPQRTGMDLHAELGRTDPGMEDRIIFMTGGAFSDASRTFLERVRNERLDKPFSQERLHAVVERTLARR